MAERIVKSPSPKQMELLCQLHRFQRRHGYAPTLDELGRILGVSKVTVYQSVRSLERKGLIRRLRNRARSIQIIDETLFEPKSEDRRPVWRLAGQWHPGGKIKFYAKPKRIDADLLLERYRDATILKVAGNPLAHPFVHDGDYLLIEPLADRHNRKIALVQRTQNHVDLCHFIRRQGRIYLSATPPSANLVPVNPADILGVVIGLLRLC